MAPQSLNSPVGSPLMMPGAIVAVSIVGVALLILVFATAWWWRRRTRRARRTEALQANSHSSHSPTKSPATSDSRLLLATKEGCEAAGHGNHFSSISSTDSEALTAPAVLPDSHAIASATPTADNQRLPPHFPTTTTLSLTPSRCMIGDTPMHIVPRLASPAPSEDGRRHPPRLTISDQRPGPDGLTPLSPRPRRTPGSSMDGRFLLCAPRDSTE